MGLAQRKFFTMGDVVGFVRDQLKFRLGGEDLGDMASATETALGFVARPRGRRGRAARSRDLRRAHRRQGLPGDARDGPEAPRRRPARLAVSAAPVELATIIAKRLGLTGALGTVSEIRGGVYTGQLVGRPAARTGEGGGRTGSRRARGPRPVPLRGVLRLGNDIPMLSLVGHPCAINPDAKLRRHARDLRLADRRLPDRPQGREGRRPRGRGPARWRHRWAPWPSTAAVVRAQPPDREPASRALILGCTATAERPSSQISGGPVRRRRSGAA